MIPNLLNIVPLLSKLLLYVMMFCLRHGDVTATPNELLEYCQSEFFSVNCTGINEVILVESAHYGRMRAARCLTGKHGKLDCSTSVLWYLDRRCSGRRQCRVYVADPVLHRVDPCSKDLSSYLEAKYTCVTVGSGNPPSAAAAECRKHRRILLQTDSTSASGVTSPGGTAVVGGGGGGYISSETSIAYGHGIGDCPYRIQASKGQRVRLSLVAFSGGQRGSETEEDLSRMSLPAPGATRPDVCYEVGRVLLDGDSTQSATTLTACGLSGDRRGTPASVLYQSEASNITVQLNPKGVLQDLAPFIIKYEAVGCATLVAPPGGWVRIDRDVALFGCNTTDGSTIATGTWRLTCSGNQWSGTRGNCSGHSAMSWNAGSMLFQNDDAFPYGILLVVSLGVALGVFIGGTMLTNVAFCMKKRAAAEARASLAETETLAAGDTYNRFHGDLTTRACTYHHQYHQQQRQPGGLPPPPGDDRRYRTVLYPLAQDPVDYDPKYAIESQFSGGSVGGGKYGGTHHYESPQFDVIEQPPPSLGVASFSVAKATALTTATT